MHWSKLTIVAISALTLSACVIAPYPRQPVYYQDQGVPVQSGVVVDVAPPPAYVEVVPAMPFVDGLWIGGYWGWYGGRHQWVPGRWEHARPGYGWQPHAWVQQGGRWHLHSGGWVRR